jgi:hypothetical protein
MSFSRGTRLFLLFWWALVVLYPDPSVLVASFRNVAEPRVDVGAVSGLAAPLPDDPREIEAEVLRRLPYATDWEVGGVPWRFPTAAQAVADGRGDCEARAVVLMSVLAAKGIPYNLRNSIDHMWVDYPGKVPTANENDALVLADREGGILHLRLPEDFDLRREVESKIALFWDPMPPARRILLALGLLLIPIAARWAAAGALPQVARSRGARPRGGGRQPGVARPSPAGKYSISS